jgi:hypothetical protein
MGSRMIGVSLQAAAEQPAGQQGDPDVGYSKDGDPQKLGNRRLARYHKIVGSPPIKVCSPALRALSTPLPPAALLVADAQRGRARKVMESVLGMLRPDVWFQRQHCSIWL